MRLAYVAPVNLPSRYAHAIQIMKSAQAMSGLVGDFEYITNLSLSNWRAFDPDKLRALYGVERFPKTVAFPLHRLMNAKQGLLRDAFYYLAAARCRLRGVSAVYTRGQRMPVLAVRFGLPVLFETHSEPKAGPELDELRAIFTRREMLGLVASSPFLAERFTALGLAEEKILIRPNGFDLGQFSALLDRLEARRRLGLPEGSVLAVYTGHLYEDRGVAEMLAAAKALPQVVFVFVGGHGQHVRDWRAKAADLGNVRFAGYVPHETVPTYLASADILLMPYNSWVPTVSYMTPMKLNEYMASGRAIVASDLPSLTVALRHEDNALLCKPDDAAALTEKLARLADDATLRDRLGKMAARDAQGLDWQSRARAILDFIETRLAA